MGIEWEQIGNRMGIGGNTAGTYWKHSGKRVGTEWEEGGTFLEDQMIKDRKIAIISGAP